MSQALVGEAGRGQQLETFDLAEVGALAEGEEVEQLRDVVSPVRDVVLGWSVVALEHKPPSRRRPRVGAQGGNSGRRWHT